MNVIIPISWGFLLNEFHLTSTNSDFRVVGVIFQNFGSAPCRVPGRWSPRNKKKKGGGRGGISVSPPIP